MEERILTTPEHRRTPQPYESTTGDNTISIISGMTVQLIVKYLLIFLFCFFWVGPTLLPWLAQIATILRGQ